MKRPLAILLLGAATAFGQIDNPALYQSVFNQSPVYISPEGNDQHSGTFDSPKATLASAVSLMGNNASIVVLPGYYTNQSINLAALSSLRVIGPAEERAVFRYGNRFTNFALHTNSIYSVTNVALGLTNSTNGVDEPRVYEEGTPSLPVTNSLPLQRGRTNRLDHTFFKAASSLETLTNNASYFYTNSTLFFITSDGGSPTNKTIVVSSTNSSDSFIYGGQSNRTKSVHIANIEIEAPNHGLMLDNVAQVQADRIRITAATLKGVSADKGGDIVLNWPWISATVDDGITIKGDQSGLAAAASKGAQVVINNPWIHDVIDKAIVAHERVTMDINGGLIENNQTSGIMAFTGGEINMRGVTTRNHATEGTSVGFGSLSASEGGTGTYVYAQDCVSIKDRIAFRMNPSSASQVARIEVVNATIDGSAGNHIAAFFIPHTNAVTQQFVVRGVALYNGGNAMNSNSITDIQGVAIYRNGTPESNSLAPIGSMAFATNGGTNTTLFIKESGANANTGWVGK